MNQVDRDIDELVDALSSIPLSSVTLEHCDIDAFREKYRLYINGCTSVLTLIVTDCLIIDSYTLNIHTPNGDIHVDSKSNIRKVRKLIKNIIKLKEYDDVKYTEGSMNILIEDIKRLKK